MRNIFILLFLLLITPAASQTHRFIYELQLKMDSTENEYQKFNMILDINSKEVKFYGRNLLIADSLNKKFGNMDNKHVDMSGQIVKRKMNSFNNENFINIKFGYYSFKTTDKINWTISDETKNVQGYKLQKATTTFGGRNWTAWFSKDIPFNEGPFKFRGLPGLIFEIQDSNNNFIYHLIKSQKLPNVISTDDFLESNFGTKAIPVTEKQKKKLLMEFYNDPFAFERTNFSKANTNLNININGKEIRTLDDLNTQTKNMQEVIRKYNNPVEIDKAIRY
ncbi:GLPGLI family protein [Chryseobacterium daecheongense]|uniref:GLPGLI family protein n=1 Tax=Chryseobacterium daecheongense TaxID=192389 RepID=UPI001FD65B8B|nr:GLPGLI family protein [Chryseobacterium daecheongense]UOU97954.1 GLPGLI family protein [Chryseobacterium daecheongense]